MIDKLGRVFGYDNLYVADGSIVPVNLSVNPSLTICALGEWIMSHVPAKNSQPVHRNPRCRMSAIAVDQSPTTTEHIDRCLADLAAAKAKLSVA